MEVEKIVLRLIEGSFVEIEAGVTDEGDSWFSAGESHLTVGKDCRLFKNWELILTTDTPKDLLSEVLKETKLNSEVIT
jgi:hypothetical protein